MMMMIIMIIKMKIMIIIENKVIKLLKINKEFQTQRSLRKHEAMENLKREKSLLRV
jgi:hypothetical protein